MYGFMFSGKAIAEVESMKKNEKNAPGKGTGQPIRTDPQGMYTGRPADCYEVPVQDADDL